MTIVHDKSDVGAFPIGAAVTVDALVRDPYPTYALLRAREPVSWIRALEMWYVSRYEDVRAILMDDQGFTTAFDRSLIYDTFGAQMLTSEGLDHERYRRPMLEHFSARFVRNNLEGVIHELAYELVAGFKASGCAELRQSFAARLPIQVILRVFGIPLQAEARVRRWYDSFERALANFTWSQDVRHAAQVNVSECHQYLSDLMSHAESTVAEPSLLRALITAPESLRLRDDEIRRNMLIILFGGISTVEAVILNSLWALFSHPESLGRVRQDLALIGRVIDETQRWLSPVQSATRHVVRDVVYQNVQFSAGDVVNCMLGAANHDETVFPEPERFDIDRRNAQRHLGFATGVHTCLGFNLAKAEARIALQVLFGELDGLTFVGERSSPPEGYEFRQPRTLFVRWGGARG